MTSPPTVELEEPEMTASPAGGTNVVPDEPSITHEAALAPAVHDPEAGLATRMMQAADRTAASLRKPTATYRLQLNHRFRFADATAILPYLQRLGISHAYASPYLKSVHDSEHGYDLVDHSQLNPQIGSAEDFENFVRGLRQADMGHLLDFVPNHMGVASNENSWWQDVLENGPSSQFSSYFDIDWSPLKAELKNKVLLPVLGDQFGRVLENQQLQLEFAEGVFTLKYYERQFPIAPRSYVLILSHRLDELTAATGTENPDVLEYQSILTALRHLPHFSTTDPARRAERDREKEIVKRRLRTLCEQSPVILQFIQENVRLFNGEPGNPRSFDLLEKLLDEQAYRLSNWRVASDEINYRRFFDVNGLAAVCMEQPEVFARSHAFVLKLLEDGQLDGLRIDHADGLYDPAGYLRNLQVERLLQFCRAEYRQIATEMEVLPWESFVPRLTAEATARYSGKRALDASRAAYVVVEKILEGNEKLPSDWAVDGTSGYDFLADVNSLFVNSQHERAFNAIYEKFIGEKASFDEMIYHCKRLIMKVSMASELYALGHQLDRISECQRWSHDFTLNGLTLALRDIVACFPVYRTYIAGDGVQERDRTYIERAVARAKRRNPAESADLYDFIRDLLLLRGLERASENEKQLRQQFVGRFQQFTGPMMAKAVEDTAFYRYARLVSLNEVGGDPHRFGLSISAFHTQNQERQARYPHSLIALSTHDTKRSEDVRARINTLSEIPAKWKECVLKWSRWNKRKKIKVDGELAPSRNDEYLLYQTLVGTWPATSPSGAALDEYVERLCQYMTKALREAKVNSSWISPNEAYEKATHDFIKAILAAEPASAFRVDFEPFADLVMHWGWWNSLSQTLLKLTCPGVPDTYPGTEVWSLRLVDPDNRRPVDFGQLERQLAALETRAQDPDRISLLKNLVERATDGNAKLFLHQQALQLRRGNPELFTSGRYIPLAVAGSQQEQVCAFARIHGNRQAIVVVPRLVAGLVPSGQPPIGESVWLNAAVLLPPELQGSAWNNVLSGETFAGKDRLHVSQALAHYPVSLFERTKT